MSDLVASPRTGVIGVFPVCLLVFAEVNLVFGLFPGVITIALDLMFSLLCSSYWTGY